MKDLKNIDKEILKKQKEKIEKGIKKIKAEYVNKKKNTMKS